MQPDWQTVFEARMEWLFASQSERAVARDALTPVLAGAEGERVAVACLKLSDGDPVKLQDCVAAALTDYRDVLAWAESPRQMRIGPGAPPEEQARARRADSDEYSRWLDAAPQRGRAGRRRGS